MYKPAVIIDGKRLVLFDTGTPGSFGQIQSCVDNLGFALTSIKTIIISHAHADHVSELKHLVDVTGAEVCAHEAEVPYVEKEILGHRDFDAVKVDVRLKDGDVMDILGGIKVVHTPGHTPGHISLYCLNEKTLLAADLFRYSRGEFHLCPPQYSSDYPALLRSMAKVSHLDFEVAVLYHGEPIIGAAGNRFREFIDYLKAISDIFHPSIKDALAPETEG
jgi:glyoxylase-like metal-dependent hydrolase (beta-lactamase superfamily II)